MYDLIIKSGDVVDGQGTPRRCCDIAVQGDRIAKIDSEITAPAAKEIRADGRVVSPGFIDIHGHSDWNALLVPAASNKLRDGVTTEIAGNCGASSFPLRGEQRKQQAAEMQQLGLSVDWEDMAGYLRRLESGGSAINRGTFVGHGAIRSSVLGCAARAPSDREMDAMKQEVASAMGRGAFGLSSGLVYPPGCFAATEEVAALARVAAQQGGMYVTHMRNESEAVLESVEETLAIMRESGCRGQISHLKILGRKNWPLMDALAAKIRAALDQGMDLLFDRYPYTACSTSLHAFLPREVYAGGPEAEMQRLRDAGFRCELKQFLAADYPSLEAWESVRVSRVFDGAIQEYEGKTIKAIAEATGADPADAYMDIIVQDRTQSKAIFFNMSADHLAAILKWPQTMIGSDGYSHINTGIALCSNNHPRDYGTFARTLGKYVRQDEVLSLEDAVHKMTGLPARRLRLGERGVLSEGAYADITIFDPDTIIDKATFDQPLAYSQGVSHVIVNGRIALEEGSETGVLSGRFVRPDA